MVKVVPKYEGIATLGVNLNRQKYGPLDVSSVLLTENDLIAYVAGDEKSMSSGWTGGVPYPYPGQIIVTLDTNTVWQLYLKDEVIAYRKMFEMPDFYSKEEINEMLQNVSVDLTGYYTKEEVDNLLSAIEPPEVDLGNYYTKLEIDEIVGSIDGTGDSSITMAMSTEDILAAIGAAGDGVPVTPGGQVLTEMTAEEVRNIINR